METERSDSGKFVRLGRFFCSFCNTEVVRTVRDGSRNFSCGCARTSLRVTHGPVKGGPRHPGLSVVYNGIKARCYTPGNSSYHRYGGRGIIVCNEWLVDPGAFILWALDHGWVDGLEVDRRENDGPYSPDNCRIVKHVLNCRNRCSSKLTADDAAEMRRLFAAGDITKKALGDRYGVTDATAGKVINNKIWVYEEVTP